MSNQFNWHIEEDPHEPAPRSVRMRWKGIGLFFWLVTLIAVVALLTAWSVTRQRSREEQRALIDSAQEVLDLASAAMAAGDGERYFSLQDNDPDWFVANLLPANQAVTRAGMEVTNAEQTGSTIWVNAAWSEQGEKLQQVLFFQWRAGQLRRISTDPNYWGIRLQREEAWGTLAYHAVDDPWASSIANFVINSASDTCADNCVADRLPFVLEVRDDYRVTAEPNHLTIPSPRLLGLDAEGVPSDRFWRELSRRIDAYLSPATIRFAVPPSRSRDGQSLLPYALLAEQFMAENPDITIEIDYLDSIPEDLSDLALEYDGVAIPPTESMLAAGHVHDLNDFINSDPEFDQSDFYEQLWQGTQWRKRTWFMPEAGEMQVIYYDKAAYERAGYPEPSSRWTWTEMAQDVTSIVTEQPQPGDLSWGFLDVGMDSLFSYAYNWNNQCSEITGVFCQTPLKTENVAAALDWYSQMAGRPGQIPDLSSELSDVFSQTQLSAMGPMFDVDRQALLLLNFQGSRRKVAIWVDLPVTYEFHLLLSPVGVVPFPGSDRFDGITPLWLRGSYISRYSERPLAVWRWLKFLSYQTPVSRVIPARPSIAAESGYWAVLPRPLGDIMRTAFPFARPVKIEEQGMLTWEMMTTVLRGDKTPLEAAQQQPAITWFYDDLDANP